MAVGRIAVAWDPAALLQLEPVHHVALPNLGVLASEEVRLEKPRLLLRRADVRQGR